MKCTPPPPIFKIFLALFRFFTQNFKLISGLQPSRVTRAVTKVDSLLHVAVLMRGAPFTLENIEAHTTGFYEICMNLTKGIIYLLGAPIFQDNRFERGKQPIQGRCVERNFRVLLKHLCFYPQNGL